MVPSEMSLDELFKEARRALHKEKERKVRKAADPVEPMPEPHTVFSNPDNWIRTRGLALVHRETQTLLGNFWELRHRTVKDARRLVRAEGPIVVEGVEEVDFGLTSAEVFWAHSQRAEIVREWEGPVVLAEPEVRAALCKLSVVYYQGAIAAARLREPCLFHEGTQALELPAGVDILPCMTREAKIALRSVG